MTRRLVKNLTVSLLAVVAALGLVGLSACSGATADGRSASPIAQDGGLLDVDTPDAPTTDAPAEAGIPYPAFDPPMPVLESKGGPTMNAPVVVPVFFRSDPLAPQVVDLLGHFPKCTYGSTIASPYGIGDIAIAPPIYRDEAPPATIADTEIETWLQSQLDGTHPEYPPPSTNVLYALYFAPETTVTMWGNRSCVGWGAYHSEGKRADGTPFIFAVIPRCAHYRDHVGLDEIGLASSHEIIEAATDPFTVTKPAYSSLRQQDFGWSWINGGEAGDICERSPELTVPLDGTTTLVQRIWSNAAAQGGHDGCVPRVPGAYFNAIADTPDAITITGYPSGPFEVPGLRVPVGESRTVDLRVFSDAPMDGLISINADDFSSFGGARTLTPSLDRAVARNGDVVRLTVKVFAASSFGNGVVRITTSAEGRVNQSALVIGY